MERIQGYNTQLSYKSFTDLDISKEKEIVKTNSKIAGEKSLNIAAMSATIAVLFATVVASIVFLFVPVIPFIAAVISVSCTLYLSVSVTAFLAKPIIQSDKSVVAARSIVNRYQAFKKIGEALLAYHDSKTGPIKRQELLKNLQSGAMFGVTTSTDKQSKKRSDYNSTEIVADMLKSMPINFTFNLVKGEVQTFLKEKNISVNRRMNQHLVNELLNAKLHQPKNYKKSFNIMMGRIIAAIEKKKTSA